MNTARDVAAGPGLYLTTYDHQETIILVCPECPAHACTIASWDGPDLDLPVAEVAAVALGHAATHDRKGQTR